MSRSLGDHGVAEVGVTAEPVMVTDAITPEDEMLILASDGVWEFITSQEAVAICQAKHPNATAATKALIKESAARWKSAEGNYRDDISAIVVFLPIFDGLSESLTGKPAGGKAATHTFVQDADGAAVLARQSGSSASDGSTSGIELHSGQIGEIALEQQPGPGSPADFTKRRLSMASGMTEEAPEV